MPIMSVYVDAEAELLFDHIHGKGASANFRDIKVFVSENGDINIQAKSNDPIRMYTLETALRPA